MSFYSYKNANPACCPGAINGCATDGLEEKVCVQVKRVYDSCLKQQQLDNQVVTITSCAQVVNNCQCNSCGCQENQETIPPTSAPVPPPKSAECAGHTFPLRREIPSGNPLHHVKKQNRRPYL